ncbi:nuclear export factor [Favolaschia claudopus]|uniref:Nuclear export factor n=1 Tax=Favolaschia claudopus TaxID=2862362 RepID=A0AAW0D8C6_9AGAR
MEVSLNSRSARGAHNDFGARRGRNKQWVAPGSEQLPRSGATTPAHVETERREGFRGRGRGRGLSNPPRTNGAFQHATSSNNSPSGTPTISTTSLEDPVLDTQEEREKFWHELVKQREIERKTAIAEGKMDDPNVPKRLEDAISIVGTCTDMCPRFERYRRERENNLYDWEKIHGTNRVDHSRAVKMYERAAGDKTIPSDLRPPLILKRTLDYLFHDLIPRGGFSATYTFVRDRSRAVRNDFTMQHDTGALAMECHERCARFHILALFLERDQEGFSIALEEQQLMNTLQSLKEFYNDQRGVYQSPAELEMRIYHRLIHIRDQVERPEPVPLPQDIADHPMYKLTTAFRAHVQEKSKPITKASKLRVGPEGMGIFGQLAGEMMGGGEGGKGMVFLVACLLERLFGKGTVEDIEDIRGGESLGDIIDGTTGTGGALDDTQAFVEEVAEDEGDELDDGMTDDATDQDEGDVGDVDQAMQSPAAIQPSASGWLAQNFGPTPGTSVFGPPSSTAPQPASAFANLGAAASPGKSVFASAFAPAPKSVFASSTPNPFASTVFPNSSTTNLDGSVKPPPGSMQPQASTSTSSPAATNGFAVPPRVQNNPFAQNTALSPFAPPSSSSPTPVTNTTPPANIFASSPKPSDGDLTDKGKGKATGFPSWTATPSTSTLNAKAPEFTPPPSLLQSAATKPIFGVKPIPLFPGSISSASSSSLPAFTTPPPPKPAPPSLTKIDTTPPVAAAGPSSPMTPRIPPPLGRVQPISLPSTPTIGNSVPAALATPDSGSFMIAPQPTRAANPMLSQLKTSGLSMSPSGSGMLSPLVLSSPSMGPLRTPSFSPVKPTASASTSAGIAVPLQPPSPLRINGDFKGKGKATATVQTEEELEAKALVFEQTGTVMRRCLALWQKRTTDRAEWAEACRQSEKYSEKVRRARGTEKRASPNGVRVENRSKRMKLLENGRAGDDFDMGDVSVTSVSSSMKRSTLRKRKYESPRTDEALAKRFQENKEEHARRWARGSFLQVTRSHFKSKSKSTKSPSSTFWRIWLSLNPETDATAIWLECKFDVPGSGGQWETENVFSIPILARPPPLAPDTPIEEGYPGVIVFECTPLEGVDDDLERKYRILDDCTRLRDIINALPENRHFVPSLLLFVWTADEAESTSETVLLKGDLLDMVNKLLADSVISSFCAFRVTAATTELDRKFEDALNLLQFDVCGTLVQSLTLRDVFKIFDPAFHSFITEWMNSCSVTGQFDWTLYCRLLDAAVNLLNTTASLATSLLGIEADNLSLPAFRPDWNWVRDSDSTFEAVGSWLDNPQLNTLAAGVVATDLQSHREIGREFPTTAFVDHLRSLSLYQCENGLDRDQTFFVSTKAIRAALEKHAEEAQLRNTALTEAQRMSMRRSPRRRTRSLSEETEVTTSSYFNKRRRISSNFGTSTQPSPSSSPPQANGRTTPSPSNSTVSLAQTDSSSAPRVTVAMLRALTKDVKSKYGMAKR